MIARQKNQLRPKNPPPPDGPLGQDDIDALLAEMNGDDAAATEEPAATAESTTPDRPLGQDDIDALLAEMNGEDAAAEEPLRQPNRRHQMGLWGKTISMPSR